MTVEAAIQLALGHRAAGRQAEAEAVLRQIVAVQPGRGYAWHQLGLVVLTQGRPGEAIELLGCAVVLQPGEAALHSDLGVAHFHQRNVEQAVACFQQSLRLQPNLAGTHRNLGDAFLALGRTDEAIVAYRNAIALAPADAGGYNNLGNVYLHLDQLEEAAVWYERATQVEPRLLIAHSNLGDVLTKLGQPDAGLACSERVLALDPNFSDGHLNKGVAFWRMARFAEAEACYRRAIALRADFADAHLNLGVLKLMAGEYEEGWREYEWHWLSPTHPSRRRDFAAPPWDGVPAAGKMILTYADQGYGDTLQFVRYLPLLLEQSRAAHVIVECQGALIPLLQQMGSAQIEFVASGSSPPAAHDLHVPLFNLPLALRHFEPLMTNTPYLRADEQKRAAWRERLGPTRTPRVGLAWMGNPAQADNRRRSMTPGMLQPILDVPEVTFVTLQIEPRDSLPASLVAAGVLDLRAHIDDFSDSAALMAELDLLITTDTSTANLAGALHLPSWIMLSFVPDWRWGFAGPQTPWYPTLRLFRQPRAGDWKTVVEQVAVALRGCSGGL